MADFLVSKITFLRREGSVPVYLGLGVHYFMHVVARMAISGVGEPGKYCVIYLPAHSLTGKGSVIFRTSNNDTSYLCYP